MGERANEGAASERASAQPDSPVCCYPVCLRGATIGYLFASSTEKRAGLIVVPLVDISLSIHSKEIWVSLMVRHDIWSFYDFSGNPHPEIYEKNAPRLTAALKAIENELDAETVEGEPTFFAEPEQYGIAIDEPDESGKGVDSTMFL
ncbi:hypothetical protein HFP72_32640 [Nocardiopsis sp. ARC36]